MYLVYIQVRRKYYTSRKARTTYNLEWIDYKTFIQFIGTLPTFAIRKKEKNILKYVNTNVSFKNNLINVKLHYVCFLSYTWILVLNLRYA